MVERIKEDSSVVFVSTGGFSSSSSADIAEEFSENMISAVELSGGQYSPDLIIRLEKLSKKIDFRVHNYFPPPKVPFVFNLASGNSDIAKKSTEHVRNSINLANKLGSSVYSFHAGFLIDPQVNELGKKIGKRQLSDRDEAMERFITRIKILAEEAELTNSKILIENNVLSATNLKSFGENPLLLTSPDEIEMIMKIMPKNVRLLLDVAHLKVSARSLGFSPEEAHRQLLPYIDAYHLSDNNGTEDSNMPFDESAWFWKDLKTNLDYYSVEVYREPIEKLRAQQVLVEKMLNNV